MASLVRFIICCLFLALLGACAGKPIRHLASDASLIKPGVSTKEDVLTFLGDPDTRQNVSENVERWIYYEEEQSSLQKAPYLGRLFNARGYNRIVVLFEGDNVTDSRYNSYESDEFDWSDDYPWQEKRQ